MRTAAVLLLASLCLPAQRPPQRGPARPQSQQQQSAPQTPATLSGRVFDAASGAPVPRALLTLRPQERAEAPGSAASSRTTSNADGAFQIANIPPGRYFLSADKPGFLPARYGARSPSSAGELIVLAESADKTGLDLPMQRQGVISGRIVDQNGDPVERGFVSLYDARTSRRAPSGGATSDDRGEFRIAKVPPGTYKLLASRSGNPAELPVEQSPGQPPYADAPTYFPSALDAAAAAPVKIAAGQERTGLEIRLGRSPLVNVSGAVTGDLPQGRARVSLRSASPSTPGAGFRFGGDSMIHADGKFTLRGVRPGQYHVVVSSFDRGGPKLLGKTPISVGPQDLTGVTVPLSPPINVDGRLRADGDPPFTLTKMNLSLLPAEFTETAPVRAKVNDDGSFSFESVPRDKMILQAQAPQGIVIKEILAAGQPLPTLAIDFSAVTGPLEIVLSNKPAQISGVIENLSPNSPGITVVVLPDDEDPLPNRTPRTVRVAPGAPQFTIPDLRPGAYTLAAFESVGSEFYTQPALWRPHAAKLASVKVSLGDTSQVKLTPLTPADLEQ